MLKPMLSIERFNKIYQTTYTNLFISKRETTKQIIKIERDSYNRDMYSAQGRFHN